MKSLAISVKTRESVGKTNSRSLRNQGNVPCVLYGGEKQVCFYAHENDFRKLVYTPDIFVINLNIDGEIKKAIMQDIQFHPVTEKILHLDFLEVFDDKPITVSVPVVLNGLAIGVRNGGVLMFRRRKIITRGLIDNLPDMIEIDIENVEIGQFIYIKDLSVEGCEFLAPESSVVVGVKTARAAIEETVVEEDVEGEESGEGEEGDVKEAVKEGDSQTKEENSDSQDKDSSSEK